MVTICEIESEISSKVYTLEQWRKDGDFNAKPGQRVSPDLYDFMESCVESLRLPRAKAEQALRQFRIPIRGGFLLGKSVGTDKEGNEIYLAFAFNKSKGIFHYYYIGTSKKASPLNGKYYLFNYVGYEVDKIYKADQFTTEKEAIVLAEHEECSLYRYTFEDDTLISIEKLYDPADDEPIPDFTALEDV